MITVNLKRKSWDEIVKILTNERNRAVSASQTIRCLEILAIIQEMHAGKTKVENVKKVELRDSVKIKDKGIGK